MNRNTKILFLALGLVVAGGAFLLVKVLAPEKADLSAVPWVTVDEAYPPGDPVESFIKTDAENRGALPVQIRNYGRSEAVLKLFKGKKFAQPSANVLSMFFKALEDWKVVDIKYKAENEREIVRTVLYVLTEKRWTVGDTGVLVQ